MPMAGFEEGNLNRLENVESSQHSQEPKHDVVLVVSGTIVHLNNQLPGEIISHVL